MIGVFQFWSCTPHLEISLEIASSEALAGKKVHYYWGGDDILVNEDNRNGKLGSVFASQKPIVRALKAIEGQYGKIFDFFSGWISYSDVKNFTFSGECVEDISSINYENFKLGLAALNSVSFLLQSDLKSIKYASMRHMIEETMYSGLGVYLSALKLLKRNKYEKVVLFNGRFVNDAAIAAACKRMGVPVEYHERGAKPDRFKLVPFPVHDRKNTRKLIDEFWNKNLGNREKSEKIARDFFTRRVDDPNFGGAWHSHTREFDRKMSGEELRQRLGVINQSIWTFFHSSVDEYQYIDPALKKQTEWGTQENLVLWLAENCSKNTILIVRMHPHLMKKNPIDLNSWKALEERLNRSHAPVQFIWPQSDLNSYLLIQESKKVLSYGSTAGAEAIFLGKQSISCNESLWGGASGAREVYSFAQLQSALDEDYIPDPESVIPFGYFMARFGHMHALFEPFNLTSGKFLGLDLFNSKEYV